MSIQFEKTDEDIFNKVLFLTKSNEGFYCVDKGDGVCVCIEDSTLIPLITLQSIRNVTKAEADSMIKQEITMNDLLERIIALENALENQ